MTPASWLAAVPLVTVPSMDHRYRFKRGDRVYINYSKFAGLMATVDSRVFQKTVDYPDDYSPGYHVVLSAERVARGYGAVGPGRSARLTRIPRSPTVIAGVTAPRHVAPPFVVQPR